MRNEEFQIGTISGVECFKEAWELLKPQYWLLFGIMLVGVLIGGATAYILLGAMLCGIYMANLALVDREAIQFDILFKGFQHFIPGLVVTIFLVAPIIIVYLMIYIPFIAVVIFAEQSGNQESIGPMLIGVAVFDFCIVVAMVCFHTLMIFAYHLVVDRGLGAITAIKLSAKAVWKNLGGVTSLILVNMVISLLGMAALCIGIYFTIPLMLAATTVAYRKLFPKLGAQQFMPPPPDAYQGL